MVLRETSLRAVSLPSTLVTSYVTSSIPSSPFSTRVLPLSSAGSTLVSSLNGTFSSTVTFSLVSTAAFLVPTSMISSTGCLVTFSLFLVRAVSLPSVKVISQTTVFSPLTPACLTLRVPSGRVALYSVRDG